MFLLCTLVKYSDTFQINMLLQTLESPGVIKALPFCLISYVLKGKTPLELCFRVGKALCPGCEP